MKSSKTCLIVAAALLISALTSCVTADNPPDVTDPATTAGAESQTHQTDPATEAVTDPEALPDTAPVTEAQASPETDAQTAPETEPETEPEIESDSITLNGDYVIVHSESVSTTAFRYGKDLRVSLAKHASLRLKMVSDAEIPSSEAATREIVLGVTDRPESIALAESLSGHEWCVAVRDEKIYVVGKTDKALLDALRYFTSEYVDGKETITMKKDAYRLGNKQLQLFENGETVVVHGGGSYPRIYRLRDGTLLYGIDGLCFRSEDDGLTWSAGVDYRRNYQVVGEDGLTYTLGCANTAFYEMEDGTLLVAYRATGHVAQNSSRFCTKILVSQSHDGGLTWEAHSTMCEYYDEDGLFRGTWEPHFGLLNGVLTCFYANDSRSVVEGTDYQHIEYVQWIDGEWTNRTIAANGLDHISRDGMPVWQQLSDGRYVCAIEGWLPDSTALAIQLFYSDDGVHWSEPVTVYRAYNGVVGAPYVVEIPGTNRLVISFQTSENTDGDDAFAEVRMFSIVSDGTPVDQLGPENFSAAENVFGTEPGQYSIWNGLYVTDEYLYACTGTNGSPSGMLLKRVPLAEVLSKLED